MVDDKLQLIARFLRAANRHGPVEAPRGVEIDVDVLGWRPPGARRRADAPPGAGRIVFPIRVAPSYVLLGPVVDGTGPCPLCLARRWTVLRPLAERHSIEEGTEGVRLGQNPLITPFTLDVMRGIFETALKRYGEGPAPSAQPYREVYGLSLETHAVSKQLLIRDSLCPGCARPLPDTPGGAAVRLSPRLKPDPNSYRERSAGDLNLPEAALANPLCGVLGSFSYPFYGHRITSPVSGGFEITGTRGDHAINWSGNADSYADSLRVALLEGLERHAGLLPRAKGVAVFDSYNNLKEHEHTLDPAACGLYSEELYRTHGHFTAYDPDLAFSWVWGYSLTEARPILVPKQLAYYTDFVRAEHSFVQDCSNGCAIGSSTEEAIFSSLMELVERDSFLISWYASLSLPKIDPWSSREPETLFILDRIERLGLDVYLLDMRLDLPVPTVMCLAIRRDRELGTLTLAAGSSFDPEKAIRGALVEVASYVSDFPARISSKEAHAREMLSDYANVRIMEDHALLYGLPEMFDRAGFLTRNPSTRSVQETYAGWREEVPRTLDLRDDIQFCLDRLAAAGLSQVIVVDQTSPEQEQLGLKTTCVIVPGLIPMDFGYGRERFHALSRMRTVPRTAGFRPADLTGADFNPLPHPFP